MNDNDYVKQLMTSKQVERKKTAKQVHNAIFTNKTKKLKY
jgi:hypothetical protein